jgi:hypothetical protein
VPPASTLFIPTSSLYLKFCFSNVLNFIISCFVDPQLLPNPDMSPHIPLPDSVILAQATEEDVQACAEVVTQAYLLEAICPFFFTDWPNSTAMFPFFHERLQKKFLDPNSEIFKLTSTASGQVVGCVCMTLSTGDEVEGRNPIDLDSSAGPPSGINLEFAARTMVKLDRIEKLMTGKKHYSLLPDL